LRNTNIVALYAPWYEVDAVCGALDSKFYDHNHDYLINKGDYFSLVDFISENGVYSEIGIFQTKFIKSMLVSNPLAYWAFTMPAELCSIGDLYYDNKPFYHHIFSHPADNNAGRSQVGLEEAQTWDKYRGGLEYLLGLAAQQKPNVVFSKIKSNIDKLIIERMICALKIRSMYDKDWLETYFLASRLRGQGVAIQGFESLRIKAGLAWLTCQIAPNYEATKVVLSNGLSCDAIALIEKASELPVEVFTGKFDPSCIFLDCLDGAVRGYDLTQRFAFYITSHDLFKKFP